MRGILPTTAEVEPMVNDLGVAVGCMGTGADLVACLRGKPADTLVTALHHASQPPGGLLQGSTKVALWLPTIDGAFLDKSPYDTLSAGAFNRVPLLVGTTSAEGKLFHAGLFGDVPLKTEADYEPALARNFGTNAAAVAARFPVSAFKSPDDALARVDTLAFFTCPARNQARLVSKTGVPVYLYEHRRVPVNGTITALSAVHATDLTFLFDSEGVTGGAPGDDARGLVDDYQDYWGRFASSGDPNGGKSLVWPRYDSTDPYLALDVPVSAGAAVGHPDLARIDEVREALELALLNCGRNRSRRSRRATGPTPTTARRARGAP